MYRWGRRLEWHSHQPWDAGSTGSQERQGTPTLGPLRVHGPRTACPRPSVLLWVPVWCSCRGLRTRAQRGLWERDRCAGRSCWASGGSTAWRGRLGEALQHAALSESTRNIAAVMSPRTSWQRRKLGATWPPSRGRDTHFPRSGCLCSPPSSRWRTWSWSRGWRRSRRSAEPA